MTPLSNNIAVVGKKNHLHWPEHVAGCLTGLCDDVSVFQVNARSIPVKLARGVAKLIGTGRNHSDEMHSSELRAMLEARTHKLVLFVGCFFVSLPYFKAVSSLKNKPLVVGWDGDNHAVQNPGQAAQYADHIDILLTSDGSAIPLLSKTFKRVEYLPFAANPEVHADLGLQRDKTFYFCGQRTPYREELLTKGLSKQGLTLCGKRWKNLKPPTTSWQIHAKNRTQSDMNKDLNRHLAGVNIHQKEHGSAFPVNMRTFEVPASGALLVCDRRGALPALFDDGEEILTFDTGEELAEIAEAVCKDNRKAARIAASGAKRILSEHTYQHRAHRILQIANEH